MMDIEVRSQPMYEDGLLGKATGGVLRPGGLVLTDQLLRMCDLPAHARILDVGCGTGSTVDHLLGDGCQALGIDRSGSLLQEGAASHPGLPLACGLVEYLPLASNGLDAVLAECSLSAMADIDAALTEFHRVLRAGGCLALSDIYARDPRGIPALRNLPLSCSLRDALTRDELVARLQAQGFEIIAWQDHSETLKVLAAQIILAHGSLDEFWNRSEPAGSPNNIQAAIKQARLGYFLMAARTL